MKKILLCYLIGVSSLAFGQLTFTAPSVTYPGASFGSVTTSGGLQGTLTSVSINATLSASVQYTYANDLTILVTPTSSISTTPYVLQVGGYYTFGSVPEKGVWDNGGSSAAGTVLNDSYTLTTPLNFTTNSAYSVWMGNGYTNTDGTNSGTWTDLTLTLTGVSQSALGAIDITEKSDIDIMVYPNPVTEVLNVKSKDSKVSSISISDLSGKAVKTVLINDKKNNVSINVSELSAGNYILIIDTEKGKFSKKFIKK